MPASPGAPIRYEQAQGGGGYAVFEEIRLVGIQIGNRFTPQLYPTANTTAVPVSWSWKIGQGVKVYSAG